MAVMTGCCTLCGTETSYDDRVKPPVIRPTLYSVPEPFDPAAPDIVCAICFEYIREVERMARKLGRQRKTWPEYIPAAMEMLGKPPPWAKPNTNS